MYKDYNEMVKWSKDEIADILAFTGGSRKLKSEYYDGLQGKNPEGAFRYDKSTAYGTITLIYFFFGTAHFTLDSKLLVYNCYLLFV